METPDIDFKELWASQKSEQPNLADLLQRVDRYKKLRRRHTVLANLSLSITAAFILFVWYYYQPQLVTTKIGIVIIIAAIALYIIAINKDRSLFRKADESNNNQQYLNNLLEIKAKQHVVETTVLNIYFALLSLGIALYMYEYASRMTMVWATVTYGITAVWILLNWFYLRPLQIRKQQARLNGLIGKLKSIQVQLNQE